MKTNLIEQLRDFNIVILKLLSFKKYLFNFVSELVFTKRFNRV